MRRPPMHPRSAWCAALVMSARVLTLVAVVGATCLGLVAAVQTDAALTALVTVSVVVALLVLRRWLAPSWLSPVYLAVWAYLLFALLGGVLYSRLANSVEEQGLSFALSPAQVALTSRLYLLAAAAIAAGALSWVAIRRPEGLQTHVDWAASPISARSRRVAYVVCSVPLVAIVLSAGPDLLVRDSYIADPVGNVPLLTLALVLASATVAILGYLFVGAGRLAGRAYVLLLSVAYFVVFFAMGSRRLALIPVLFAVGALASNPRSPRLRLLVLAALALGFYLIQLPLALRSLPQNGLIPYVQHFGDVAAAPFDWSRPAFNLLMSFGITGTVAWSTPAIPFHDYLVSLNPLPGGAAGWYDIAPSLRLNDFTPYSALGELGNAGWFAVGLYFFAVGVLLAYVDSRVRRLMRSGHRLAALLLVGCSALFVLISLQYNLRSATRMLIYLALADVLVRLVLHVRTRRGRLPDRDAAVVEPRLRDVHLA